MSEYSNINVLVVGAGPVGLFCANELMRHGLRCRIIDKKTNINQQSRALGIHIRTLDLLEDCGFIDKILQQGHKVEGVLIKSKGKTLLDATFSGIKASDRHYLVDLPQNQTEAILYQSLLNKGGIVEWGTELTHLSQAPEEITATLKKPNNFIELFHANWIIACDGAHSTLRHQVGAEFKGSSYQQAWWLADLLIDWTLPDNRMIAYIDNEGPLACFPMGNKRYRLVLTAPKGSSTDPSLEDVTRVFKERSSDPATLSQPNWLSQFSIHHRQIEQYRYDRVFFAGDSAHIHSPMGGQGLNTGMQDIYNLVWKLALVEQQKAKPELLDSYHEERFPIGREVLKKTDKMTRMMLLKSPLAIKLRNKFIRFIASFARVKNFMAKDIAELSISYANSSIVHHSGCTKYIKAGDFLPNFELLAPATQQKYSSKIISQTTKHHLFIFAGLQPKKIASTSAIADRLAQRYADSIQVHLILCEESGNTGKNYTVWLDPNKKNHLRFGYKKPGVILVRPDKYIGIVQKPINEKKLAELIYLTH